ncbi:MAG: RidA family protein [Pyramidobacter sp.]|nr:RidA family protein [Pyramidobacter sp.]
MKPIETVYSVRDGGHYVPAVEVNGTVYVSGQLSIDPATGKVPAGGIKAQARQALSNLELVLGSAGLKKDHVAFCRVYLPDVKYWPELNEVYAEFFGEHKPARIVVPTNNLYAGCLVEVEAVASRN